MVTWVSRLFLCYRVFPKADHVGVQEKIKACVIVTNLYLSYASRVHLLAVNKLFLGELRRCLISQFLGLIMIIKSLERLFGGLLEAS